MNIHELFSKSIWSFDFDGVFNDYPAIWLHYIYLNTGIHFKDKDKAKKILKNKYYSLKKSYRLSNYKYQVQVNQDVTNFIFELRKQKKKIIISTSRPFELYSDMERRTEEWLTNNKISFDYLTTKNSLTDPQFDIHVDDEIDQINLLKNKFSSKDFILYDRLSRISTYKIVKSYFKISSFKNII